MTNDELQDLLEIGRQAEEFNNYLADHPYFDNLLERIKLELMQRMYSLSPLDKDEFTSIMTKMHFLPDVRNAISGDISMASYALGVMEGKNDEKGIL